MMSEPQISLGMKATVIPVSDPSDLAAGGICGNVNDKLVLKQMFEDVLVRYKEINGNDVSDLSEHWHKHCRRAPDGNDDVVSSNQKGLNTNSSVNLSARETLIVPALSEVSTFDSTKDFGSIIFGSRWKPNVKALLVLCGIMMSAHTLCLLAVFNFIPRYFSYVEVLAFPGIFYLYLMMNVELSKLLRASTLVITFYIWGGVFSVSFCYLTYGTDSYIGTHYEWFC
jgi:hypothetical protein